ncbi:MAG: ABC transporter permease [Bacteriovoracaceae bacterium]
MLKNENKYLFKFAWKNIQQNPGRSVFIGLSVCLAVVLAVWVVSFFDGLDHQIEQAVVNTNTGYFQIQEPLFSKTTDSSKPLALTDALKEKLSQKPYKGYSPELVLDGNISTPEGATGLVVLGIDPAIQKSFLPISKSIISGEFIHSKDDYSVVIGQELASFFKFHVGDTFVLNYQDVKGELRSEILSIKGIYHYNSKSFEKKFIYINQKTWQTIFLNQYNGQILFNRIPVMTENLSSEFEVKKQFENQNLVIKSWKQLNPEMAVVLEFHNGMIKFFLIIIGITITMTIMTPVQMLWQERLRELKMMNILGISSRKFWKIGLFEVIQMILLSSSFSILCLTIIIGVQSQTGVDFRFLNDGVSIERAGIKLPGIIYPKLMGEQIYFTLLFVCMVLMISYCWSIHRTLKKLGEN